MEDTASVDKQGRVYLPKDIREKAGVEPGTRFEVEADEGKIVLKPRKSRVRESMGVYKTKRPIEDIDKLIEEAVYEEVSKEL